MDKDDVPLVQICSTRAAQIGGTSMGLYANDISVTELDSYANMAVAGSGTTLIARTGQHATITPFSKSLPDMNKVEIVVVAMAYDDPFTLKTYLFVMRNAFYIPTMGHNLIPPFILWEAGLHVDKTPKRQAVNLTITNHSIFDPVTGLRVHL